MADYEIELVLDEAAGLGEWDEGQVAVLQTAVSATLHHQQAPQPAGLTLVLTDDVYIHRLNRDYLGVDKPTDVLSFPAGDPMPGMASQSAYLGDIIISVPYADRQAQAAGHNLMAELQLLAVHGVLHLLGHDHAEPDEKAAMWAAQTAVLNQLGLHNITPTGA